MPAGESTATLRRITTFPVKSLDPATAESTELAGGALAGDREFALVDADGNYVNGKRFRSIHRIRSSVDHAAGTLTVRATGGDGASDGSHSEDKSGHDAVTAPLDEASKTLTDWFSSYFGQEVHLRRNRDGGFPDDTDASGPTLVSTATIRELASWFDDISVDGMRRRLRANLEVDGVPPFWEDRLFAERDRHVSFSVGDVEFEGVNPCQRCVVPSRDPEMGVEYPKFRETFVERRRETMPPWSGGDWFDHHFRVTVNSRVPESEWGKTLAVGDEVRLGGTVSATRDDRDD